MIKFIILEEQYQKSYYGNLPSSINSLYIEDSIRVCAEPHLLHMPVSLGYSFIFFSHSTHLLMPFLNPILQFFSNHDNNYILSPLFLWNFKKGILNYTLRFKILEKNREFDISYVFMEKIIFLKCHSATNGKKMFML